MNGPSSARFPVPLLLSLLALGLVLPGPWLEAQERPVLTPTDYGKFEQLQGGELSPDGAWLAYRILRMDDHQELRVRPLARDTAYVVPWGTEPRFSSDSRWVLWTESVSPEERERRASTDSPARDGASLLDTGTGEVRTFPEVRRAAFDASGRFLALQGHEPDEEEGRGADLRVLELETGGETSFGNVGEFAWSETGALLALTVRTGLSGSSNGVQLFAPGEGRLRTLDASKSSYRRLAWREGAADLAALRSVPAAGADSTAHHVMAWRGLDEWPDPSGPPGTDGAFFLPERPDGVPDTLVVVGYRPPRWTPDGRWVQVGLRPGPIPSEEPAEDPEEGPEEGPEVPPGEELEEGAQGRAGAKSEMETEDPPLPGLQLWHTRDVRIVPMQKAQEAADARRTLLAVWQPEEGRVVRVGTDLREEASLTEDGGLGMERISAPYPWGAMFGRPYHDLWAVELETGVRRRLLEQVRYAWPSPEGRYVLTFDGADYHGVEVANGERRTLTQGLPTSFANLEYDTPTDMLPPWGLGGWMSGDGTVLLHDRHDVWSVRMDGSGGERLTRGAEEEVIHRVVRLDRDAHAFDPEADLYLSLRGEWTEQQGYARLRPGDHLERLILQDQRMWQLSKADSAESYLFRVESRRESPNLFVAGPDLASARRVTDTNPFQGDYAWTRAELLDFESEAGKRLQGVLLYPANHEPEREYPMIVYTYEMLSQQLHFYQPPSERSYYNFTAWTQHGYFVLLPDIVYRARDPGVSALEALRPAIRAVTERGLVDPARVGLIGHSWGGYQATYVPTRTDLFAASVAGAPLTDFVSFMGQIHWTPGIAEVDHWETGQARMEVPYWEDPEAHHRNSPLHTVHEMETPLLMAFGDDDGVVEWWQGTVFYNFARRAERQMVLLVYEDEGHGFTRRENQVDYHRRILEWFGHYLKGEEAPRWITDGIPLEGMEAEIRRVAEDPGEPEG
jgi:dipeptidyl aminopeptidase/acylaminoacyl peptidase